MILEILKVRDHSSASNSSFLASHFVVVAWTVIVISMVIKVIDAIISLPGAFMAESNPASAAGITPVSLVQHIKSISLKLHFARRSGRAQRKTVIGRAMSIKIETTITPPDR